MEPKMLAHCVASVKAGIADREMSVLDDQYSIEDGLAIIEINGPMMKGSSKFGGCSTAMVRKMIRDASINADVKEILLLVESGGGSVYGTKELADDVKKANEKKRVTSYINDLGASAAYWVASQASTIFCNEMAEIGSIGVVAIVEDSSGAYEREGVKVHVISTGSMKGAFADGAPVTDEMLADLQDKVDQINNVFKGSVMFGRSMSAEKLDAIADGRTFTAKKSLELGLVDGIDSLESVIDRLKTSIILQTRKEKMDARLGQSVKR